MESVEFGQVAAAARVVGAVVRRTPVVGSRVLSERAGVPVWLKCENLQRTGSFKPRGAYYRIANLSEAERARGVVAASAGNHAQGVAWSAAELGITSTVFMPIGASLPKLVATRAYGAEVHQVGETIDEVLVAAKQFAERTGATLIHPFDHPDIVAGQASVALEILEQVPDVRTVVVPTGGGGLLAGVAIALNHRTPQVGVVGVQAADAAAWPDSLRAGTPVRASRMSTMADGIAVGMPGAVPFDHVSKLVSRIVTVDEESLSKALLLCLERAKLIVEPAGAAGVAALLGTELRDLPGPIVVILSGGNIDPLLLTRVINHGLSAAGRYLAMRVTISDRPGALSALLGVVGRAGASVVDVVHSRTGTWLAVDEVEVSLTVEMRGPAHRDDVLDALREAGFRVRAEL
ncbi:threonine ammonia-lyase [Nocardia caishijiensis]|uniref:threonine ammonia-lyase n=1 Tax=Nocardia caishijiensis TaxID=184756 RepID=A0ABQ6YH87_9NOCA|nr:threonine ammonia-lyase [Nocardia caishijiensis]KAF0845168.1 threonine dehydratase [Nocardia caishijiensis]